MLRFGRFLLRFSLVIAAPWSAESLNPAPPRKPTPDKSISEKPAPGTPPSLAHSLSKSDLEAFFDGIIPLQLERSDAAGATVLVMKDGQDLLRKGYGFADVAKKRPVDPESTMFRLASISKLFTWISVMQLAEQGKLDIDTDVNRYLDFRIAPAFGKPITLRNLMTHTGGFEEEAREVLFVDPTQVTTLRDFLIENQPRCIFPPGEIPAYSNYGVGLAGYIVQRVSGEPFEKYVAEHIFQPLEMKHSSFQQPLEKELVSFPSEGYRKGTDQPALGFEIFNPAPAGGISSTASDMGRLALALLNGGELSGQRILKPETLNAMWTRQFAANDALPAMCMGFYQTWRNGLHFIGHDGDLIAFHSMFVLEPKEKLVLFLSYNSANSAAKSRPEILLSFADRYYPSAKAAEFPKADFNWLKEISGTYQSTRRSESNRLKLGGLMDQARATVDKDGVLKIDQYTDLRGHVRKWKPVSRDLWQEADEQRMLFAIRGSSGEIVRIAGGFAGVQLERVPWFENSQLVLPAVGGSLSIIALVVIATLSRFGRKTLFQKRPPFKQQPGTARLTLGTRLSAWAWTVLVAGSSILLSRLDNADMLPTKGLDKYFVAMNVFTGVAIFFSLFTVYAALRVWNRPDIRLISKCKYSLVGFACLFLTWFSIHWHLIGPAHRY